MKRVFADSHYFFAIVNPKDKAHAAAIEHAEWNSKPLLTTAWVLLEVADGFAGVADRGIFGRILRDLQNAHGTLIVEPSQDWFEAGVNLYEARRDKDWSLTDCISFEVMRHHGLKEALTGDHHFEQAGFTALLKAERN